MTNAELCEFYKWGYLRSSENPGCNVKNLFNLLKAKLNDTSAYLVFGIVNRTLKLFSGFEENR